MENYMNSYSYTISHSKNFPSSQQNLSVLDNTKDKVFPQTITGTFWQTNLFTTDPSRPRDLRSNILVQFIQKVTIQNRLWVSHWMTSNTCIKTSRYLLFSTITLIFLEHFVSRCRCRAFTVEKNNFLTLRMCPEIFWRHFYAVISYYLYKYQQIQVFTAFAENVQRNQEDILWWQHSFAYR